MNRSALQSVVVAGFGFVVIASGCIRYFGSDGGETGLCFGLVMGAIALTGAACFFFERRVLAWSFSLISLAFVGGWFFYEALVKKGWTNAEPRQLVVIAVTIAAIIAIVLLNSRTGPDSKP